MGSSDTHPQVRTGGDVRRWIDKALVGSLALIATLGSIIFGLTTRAISSDILHVNGRVDGVEKKVEKLDGVEKERGERLRALEEQRSADRENIQRFERSQLRLEEKLDEQTRDLQEILKRLPK